MKGPWGHPPMGLSFPAYKVGMTPGQVTCGLCEITHKEVLCEPQRLLTVQPGCCYPHLYLENGANNDVFFEPVQQGVFGLD